MMFEDVILEYVKNLDKMKLVVFCGDLNVVYEEIDLKNLKINCKNVGFLDEECVKFFVFLDVGFIDSFCYFYLDLIDVYFWWFY